MIQRAASWTLATTAALLALAVVVVEKPWPGLDMIAAALPLAPIMAVFAIWLGRWSTVSVLSILALVASGSVIVRELVDGPDRGGSGPKMVIITHNVGRANRDPQGTIIALAESGADVLMLQETDGAIAPYLRRLLARFPYSNSCRERCSLAIFSRWPITRVRWRFRDSDGNPFGPGLIQTRIRLPWGREARVATLHLSRTEAPAGRARIQADLASAVRQVGPQALVIGGDFNLTPWGGAIRKLDAEVLPLRRATRATFSFPAFWAGHAVPLPLVPIDHLYAGPTWGVSEVRRLPKTGSDHYPIRVKFVWRGSRR